jgi:predicted dehydrogenase
VAFRIVVVGLGGRGRTWVHEVRRHPDWDLAAVVENDPGVLAAATEDLAVPQPLRFRHLPDALAAAGPGADAVLVATAPDQHVVPCREALSARSAVLVEKPFTLELEEAVGLVEQAESAGQPLLVAQNYRYMRSHRTVRRVVEEGTLGRVGLVDAHYYRVPHDMTPSLARLPHRVMWGMGVHHLDALRFVMGEPVVGVLAQSFDVPWTGDHDPVGGSLEVLLEFEGGARATYGATYQSSGHEYFEAGQEFYQRYLGERATLHVFHRWVVLCESGKLPRWVRRGRRRTTEEAVLLQQLADALRGGAEAECSGRDNLQSVAVSAACLRSSERREWVNPQELLHQAQ